MFDSKLIDLATKLQNMGKELEDLDMNNLEDLKKAYESLTEIDNVLKNINDEYPLINTTFSLLSSLFDINLNFDFSGYKEQIKNKIDELERENTKCSVKYNNNDCNDCNDCCCHECFCDDCFCDDCDCTFNECTPEYVKECLKLCVSNYDNSKKDNDTYFKLIADYINKECPYLNFEDNKETSAERDDTIWLLYDFINFTMRR